MNPIGIRPEKKEEFKHIFQNIGAAMRQSSEYEVIIDEMFMNTTEYYEAWLFLGQYNANVYRTYNEMFIRTKAANFIPTGTCTPFARKMYISVNGKILPCERIGQQYGLANIKSNEDFKLSYQQIADIYNKYFDLIRMQCKSCYLSQACIQCMFNIDNLDKLNTVKCPGFADAKTFAGYIARNMSFLEKKPEAYRKVMEVIVA